MNALDLRKAKLVKCAQCGGKLARRALACDTCAGSGTTGMLWWKDSCWNCDGSGDSERTEPYCPRHPFTWTMPKQRFPVAGVDYPKGQPKCFTCNNTRKVVQWGILIACPTCRPAQNATDMRTKFPPPWY